MIPRWFGCFVEKQHLKIRKIHHRWCITVTETRISVFGITMQFPFIKESASICEVIKSLNNLNPEFMWSYFVFKIIFTNFPLLRLSAEKPTCYSLNSVLF